MSYHINAESISLDDLKHRIESTDLIPSQISLLEGLKEKIKLLKKQGVTSLAHLRYELKNKKRMEALAENTGIDYAYLNLLRRHIESFFPKPFAFHTFDWLAKEDIERLKKKGLKSTSALYESLDKSKNMKKLAQSLGLDNNLMGTIACISNLTRIQWVSPNAARMLIEAKYDRVDKIATADPEKLCEALVQVNENYKYFKGKIGLRDIKRLIHAAGYVS